VQRIVEADAVHLRDDGRGALAGDGQAVFRGVFDDASAQLAELGEVAVAVRQVGHRVAGEEVRYRRFFPVDRRRERVALGRRPARRDGRCLPHGRKRKREIDADTAAQAERQARRAAGLQARSRRFHREGAGSEAGGAVVAGGIGCHGAFGVQVGVGDRDLRVGDGFVGGVERLAGDGAGVRLRMGGNRKENEGEEESVAEARSFPALPFMGLKRHASNERQDRQWEAHQNETFPENCSERAGSCAVTPKLGVPSVAGTGFAAEITLSP
jgi:hypothetical protein